LNNNLFLIQIITTQFYIFIVNYRQKK